MSENYDVYGLRFRSLEAARCAVEQALGISLTAHDSGYRGGYYYRFGDVGAEHFILQQNKLPHDEGADECEWAEPEHIDTPFLLYVNETRRSAELREVLGRVREASLLRAEQL